MAIFSLLIVSTRQVNRPDAQASAPRIRLRCILRMDTKRPAPKPFIIRRQRNTDCGRGHNRGWPAGSAGAVRTTRQPDGSPAAGRGARRAAAQDGLQRKTGREDEKAETGRRAPCRVRRRRVRQPRPARAAGKAAGRRRRPSAPHRTACDWSARKSPVRHAAGAPASFPRRPACGHRSGRP